MWRRTPNRPEPEATAASDSGWQAAAMEGLPLAWLRVDADLRVLETSATADTIFGSHELPRSLLDIVRTPEVEVRAAEVVSGVRGTWEIDALHFGRLLRVSGTPVPGGALLLIEDRTEVRRLKAVRADFVANLGHELRTPVASLRLAAETLQRGADPADTTIFLDRIATDVAYIDQMLVSLKDLATMEGGQLRLRRSRFPLARVVDECWRRIVDSRGPRVLRVEIEPGAVLTADRTAIAQVLQNVLENAHQYSPPDGAITVGATQSAGGTEMWVLDQGPGIPPADRDRVFERFYKVDRARTRESQGSGLGLAIARHLVAAHGGTIRAEPGSGGGTRVAFTIPDQEPNI